MPYTMTEKTDMTTEIILRDEEHEAEVITEANVEDIVKGKADNKVRARKTGTDPNLMATEETVHLERLTIVRN